MAVQSIVEQMNSLASASNLVNESFMSAAQASIEAAAAAIQSGDSFGTAAKKIIKAFIAQGVAAAISNTLKIQGGALGLLAVPLAGLAAAGASALFDSLIPKFADGGIVSGKTLAMVGEYAGASSNPEVIAPLDKLKSLIGQNEGSGQIEIFGQLSGENINISNKRYAQNAFYR